MIVCPAPAEERKRATVVFAELVFGVERTVDPEQLRSLLHTEPVRSEIDALLEGAPA